MKEPIIIVSDPGVDDLIALQLLAKLEPAAANVLVSTFGNVAEKFTARNAQEFIKICAPLWQLYRGPRRPMRARNYDWADYFHGANGLWGKPTKKAAAKTLAINQAPGYKNILSLGPLTGVRNLVGRGNIKNITIMGGAFQLPGNETKYAESNIAFDPEAAADFFANSKGMQIRVVPLDATSKVYWTRSQVEGIPEKSQANIWIKRVLLAWFKNYGDICGAVFQLYDPLAAYSMFYPKKLIWRKSGVKIINKGVQMGRTVFVGKSDSCQIALGVRQADKVSKHIFDLVFR